jgi:geranylgeranyl pyrophosphate synthase
MENNQSMRLDDFFDTTRYDIEEKISSTINDEKIREILHGGKRLRSLLTQLAFKVCTEGKETHDDYQRSLESAVSIELAHGASLVHDDIIDKDAERRGKKAFHVKEGIGHAILTGHRMLAMGFDIALNHGKEVAKLYVDSWNEVVNGEIDEVDFNKNGHKDTSLKSTIFEAYNKIIDLKTASLFSSACEAGALEASMSGDILKVFKQYGREIGVAYQLADDLVDLANGEMIDSVIVPLLNRIEAKPIKKGSLKRWEVKRKFNKNEDKIKQYYIDEITNHVRKAEEISKSDIIPKSSYKEMMIDAPSYIINKMLREINITI